MTRISIAIVVGCLAIAGALYFGLRAREPAAPVPPVTAPDADVIRALSMQAAGQLEAQRARIDAACWTGPRGVTRYDLQLAIAADGREVGRSLLELRDPPSRADVGACVRGLTLPPLRVAPPGAPVTLTIPLVLP